MTDTKPKSGFQVAYVCSRLAGNVPIVEGQKLRSVVCIGQVTTGQILQAISEGAGQVLLVGCQDENCRHELGPEIAREQVAIARKVLELLGYERTAVEFFTGDPGLKNNITNKQVFFVEDATETVGKQMASFDIPADFTAAEFVCLECGRCSGICPIARTGFGFSPRRLIKQALAEGTALSSRAVYACLGCDLCSTVCPSGESIGQTVQRLRAIAFNNRVKPVLAHSGVIQAIGKIMAQRPKKQRRSNWITPDLQVSDNGETALFIGCLPYFDVLFQELGINSLKTARNAIRCLNKIGVTPVVMDEEQCCGHDLLWLGDVSSAKALAEHNLKHLQRAGVRRVVFLCPECQHTFQFDYPKLVNKTGLELIHISQLLAERGEQPRAEKQQESRRVITYHDPCRLGRQLGVYEPPRQLLAALPDIELREMEHNRQQALCCGGTSWLECGAAVKLMQERRLAEARAIGADTVVTACTKCEIHLRCAMSKSAENKVQIINFIDLICESDTMEAR